MEKSVSLELRRQLIHIAVGFAAVFLIAKDIVGWNFFLLVLLTGIVLSFLSLKKRLPLVSWFLENFERKNTFPGKGALFLVGGILLSVVLFEKDIALAAIMIVTFGDSASHLSGKFFGKVKHPLNKYKFLEGTLLGFAAALAGAVFFVGWQEAVIAAGIAMLVESFELKLRDRAVDDNIVIPLVAGAVITVMRLL